MRRVKIATRKQTGFGCPTTFTGLVTVDGRTEPFDIHNRGWGLSLRVAGEDITVDANTASDGVCTWEEIREPVLDALQAHFNSPAYQRRLADLAAASV